MNSNKIQNNEFKKTVGLFKKIIKVDNTNIIKPNTFEQNNFVIE